MRGQEPQSRPEGTPSGGAGHDRFDVVLTSRGDQAPRQLARSIRSFGGTTTEQAERMVTDDLPRTILEGVGYATALGVKEDLERRGATVELRPIPSPVLLLPPPPPPKAPKWEGLRRAWAIVGIVAGFFLYIVPGFFAIRSYRRWRAGTIRKPIFAWTFAWIGLAMSAMLTIGVVSWDLLPALSDELINVDFRDGVDPFNEGQNSGGIAEHVDGTYRLTDNYAEGFFTSVGDFPRAAYAVGIRAEVVELTEPGTWVGPMCLGSSAEKGQALVGYGFFVEPGGDFVLMRFDTDGSGRSLERGVDTRIDTVRRVSIECVPNGPGPAFGGSTDVTVLGFANGLKIAEAEDPDGYHRYTYAGLSLQGVLGTEVSFTRVWARVPDEEWMP